VSAGKTRVFGPGEDAGKFQRRKFARGKKLEKGWSEDIGEHFGKFHMPEGNRQRWKTSKVETTILKTNLNKHGEIESRR